MTLKNCPFCNCAEQFIINQSLHFRTIYNIAPILPGHCLVIPKRHVESFFDLDDKEIAEFMILGKQTAKLLEKVFKTNSFDWTIQEQIPAGQTILHLHMHIIPRHSGDLPNPGDWYPLLEKTFYGDNIDAHLRQKLTEEQLEQIVSNLKNEL